MNNSLTGDFEFLTVNCVNGMIAEIHRDKTYYYLTVGQISKFRRLPKDTVKQHISTAKHMLKYRTDAWLVGTGLSCRARTAIKRHYNNAKEIYRAAMLDNVDLEKLHKVGHEVSVEIRGWCIKNKEVLA